MKKFMTPSGLNPRSRRWALVRLRTNRPATTRTTSEPATWATTSRSRSRCRPPLPPGARPASSRDVLLPAAAVVLLLAVGALLVKLVVLKPAGPIDYEITPLTFDSGFTGFPTVPTDGSFMAFASDREAGGGLEGP